MTLIFAVLLALPRSQERLPPPDPAALKEAEKLVKDVFKDDYAKKAPSDKVALSKKLLEQADATKEDPAARYVLLREASAVAAGAGDVETALKATDLLGKVFKVDALDLKADTLQSAAKAARSPNDLAEVAAAYMKLSKEAAELDDFNAAEKALSAATTHAKKAQSLLLLNRASAESKALAELKSKHDKVRKMKETLGSNPDDGPANLEVGQYECFVKGNWAAGLPLLAKGSDASLKDLAAKDLGTPAVPAEQAAVGDGWWDVAEKRPPAGREHLRRRAAFWYEKAAGKLTGLSQVKTEKRLAELRAEALGRGSWLDVSDPKLYGQSGAALSVIGGYKARLSKLPEGEFDGFTCRVKIPAGKPSNVQIEYEDGARAMVIYQSTGVVTSSKLTDNTWSAEAQKPYPGRPEYVLTVLLGQGEYVGYVDSQEFFRIPTGRAYLAPFEFWVLNKGGEAAFEQIKLRRRE